MQIEQVLSGESFLEVSQPLFHQRKRPVSKPKFKGTDCIFGTPKQFYIRLCEIRSNTVTCADLKVRQVLIFDDLLGIVEDDPSG